MTLSVAFCVILAVCAQPALSELSCFDGAGYIYYPCGPGGAGAGDGTSNGPSVSATPVTSCVAQTYNGPTAEHYKLVDDAVPDEYDLVIENLNLGPGEKLTIKTFQCGPEKTCKVVVITSDAPFPLTIRMNKRRFVFATKSATASATFKVDYGC